MSLDLLAVTFDAHDPTGLARFWADVLGRSVVEDAGGALLPGEDTQLGLRFALSRTEKVGPNCMHLHLTSESAADQQRTVATALQLGASHIDVGQRPEEAHVVLADPEGNEFCVIEPDISYLAGTGFLGELACKGSREAGLFWREALDWPLVWDWHEETAIQRLGGGTKVAWGGNPRPRDEGRNRQRLELIATEGDLDAEIERLVSLGAVRLDAGEAGPVVLADPDGTEFRVNG